MSGGLFSLSSRIKPKGEALAFGVFAGISFVGFLLSFGIQGRSLEADDWESDSEHYKSDDEEPDS